MNNHEPRTLSEYIDVISRRSNYYTKVQVNWRCMFLYNFYLLKSCMNTVTGIVSAIEVDGSVRCKGDSQIMLRELVSQCYVLTTHTAHTRSFTYCNTHFSFLLPSQTLPKQSTQSTKTDSVCLRYLKLMGTRTDIADYGRISQMLLTRYYLTCNFHGYRQLLLQCSFLIGTSRRIVKFPGTR